MSYKLCTVYQYDENNYFCGFSKAMQDGNELLMPPNCVDFKPELKEGYWYLLNNSKMKWIAKKIPTTLDEIDTFKIRHEDNSDRAVYLKSLMEKLSINSDKYKLHRDENLDYFLEKIPEPTLEELKTKRLEELKTTSSAFDTILVNSNMIVNSSLGFSINADLRSQNNLRGLIALGQPTAQYKDANNQMQSVTLEDLNTMLEECVQNGSNLYAQKWQYQAQIEACKTIEELNAIEFKFTMLDFSKK